MYKLFHGIVLACGLSLASTATLAKVPEAEAAKLGKELTPYGAERAGNAAGTIPAWDGGITADKVPAEYTRPGMHHPDPFADDKMLYKITAANMAQYQDQLPAGIQALLKTYPDTFYVPVYPSRRSASAPQWVYDNIARNARTAELVKSGNGFTDAYGGVPFPIPKNAAGEIEPLMILWNHLTRWRGIYVKRSSADASVQRNGTFSLLVNEQEVDFLYYHRDGSFDKLDNRVLYFYSTVKSPARLAGSAVLVHDTLDQTREPRAAWGYNAGQRRVRRAPNLAYDMPVASADGLMTADDLDIFNGAPDRHDWVFVGKKEMLIPYNNYRLNSPDYKYADLLTPGHVNPEATRFELHRVWVIEGRLKSGQRHLYSRRTFYLDEDSWNIAVADQYDARGELWRVSLSYLMNYYEQPVLWTALDVYHDLTSQRYFAGFLDNEEQGLLEFSDEPPEEGYFSPQSLRRRSKR
ncbi:MAG: DUF1329 domain-containing protein [Gammaproteobacteria bacterium]